MTFQPDRTTSDPVTLFEIAQRLGIKPDLSRQWKARGIIPEPHWEMADGTAIYDWPALLVESPRVREKADEAFVEAESWAGEIDAEALLDAEEIPAEVAS